MKISEASRISCAISETFRFLFPGHPTICPKSLQMETFKKNPLENTSIFHFHRLFTFTFQVSPLAVRKWCYQRAIPWPWGKLSCNPHKTPCCRAEKTVILRIVLRIPTSIHTVIQCCIYIYTYVLCICENMLSKWQIYIRFLDLRCGTCDHYIPTSFCGGLPIDQHLNTNKVTHPGRLLRRLNLHQSWYMFSSISSDMCIICIYC